MKELKKTTLFILFSLFIISVSAQEAYEGYTLYNPMNGYTAYLIDMDGNIAHSWSCNKQIGYSLYLMENGHLMRTAVYSGNQLNGAAIAGLVQEIDWDGNVVWEYVYSSSDYCTHHDIEPLPNGNVLLIAWDVRSASEVQQAGYSGSGSLWSEQIIEVEPSGSSGGTIVWQWYIWDHLIQDHDPGEDNYGIVADHPELLDINCDAKNGKEPTNDWIHANGIDYNPELDQIVFSSHNTNEIYVIDHSTTTAEAAGHTGGNSGMGGDILYRWGNPANYDAGNSGNQVLDVVHAAMWVESDCPNAGNLIAFNNDGGSGGGGCADMVIPPLNGYNYDITPGSAYEPASPDWRHNCVSGNNGQSGAHFLPNGNLFVSLNTGYMYEVTPDDDVVWTFNANNISKAFRYGICYPGVAQLGACEDVTFVIAYNSVTNDNSEDGILDAGETADINVTVSNYGGETSASATITCTATGANSGYVTVNTPSVSLGTLDPSESIPVTHNITVDAGTPLYTVIELTFEVSDGEYSADLVKTFTIGELPEYDMQNDDVTTCNAMFYDPGGSSSEYGNNQNYTMTFYPAGDNNVIEVTFNSFNVENETNCNYDYLEIFDGTSTSATLIGKYCGTDSPGTVTATNNDGALTFHFYSDVYVTESGWEAEITCSSTVSVPVCELLNDINIFPNPSNGVFTIMGNLPDNSGTEISVYDIHGKLILSDRNTTTIDLSDESNGIYYLKVKTTESIITNRISVIK